MFETDLAGDLRIRPLSLEEAPSLFALVGENRAYFVDWIPFVSKTKVLADVESYIKGYLDKAARGAGFLCGIWRAERLIGIILVRDTDLDARWAEIGYMIAESEAGKGTTAAACRKLVDYLFDEGKMDKIVICCDDRNDGSVALARKLGFAFEGNLRNHFVVNGRVSDLNYWGLLREERSAWKGQGDE